MEPKISKFFKVFGILTGVVVVLLVATILVLSFTVFKQRNPRVVAMQVTLEDVDYEPFPTPKLNGSVNLVVQVTNKNYGALHYRNTTTFAYYRGSLAAEGSQPANVIPARSAHNVSSILELQGQNLISNPNFFPDFFKGSLNITSSTNLPGKAVMFRLFHLKADAVVTCNITVFFFTNNFTSNCDATLKM